jgi:hypothetical protein
MSRRVLYDRVQGPHMAKQKAFVAASEELREALESEEEEAQGCRATTSG